MVVVVSPNVSLSSSPDPALYVTAATPNLFSVVSKVLLKLRGHNDTGGLLMNQACLQHLECRDETRVHNKISALE